jgi:putative copper export protein
LPPLPLVADILTTTGFGRALGTVLVSTLLLVGTGALAWDTRSLRLAMSGAAIVALAFIGHAAAGSGAMGGARLLLMALHLIAIGAWLGALPPLLRALGGQSPDTVELLSRFGLVGGVSVAVVLASGLGTLGLIAIDARGALGTGYVRMLALKLAFVLALLALATINRFRLTPMMSSDPEHARLALRRTIVLEQVMGLGALASVSLLGQLDPGM